MHYCFPIISGLLFVTLFASCCVLSDLVWVFTLNISFTCIWSSGDPGDQDPQQAAKAGITDQGKSEMGTKAVCWLLTESVCGGSVGELKSSELTAILLALRAQLQVTALTGFVPTLLGKIRPLPYKKPNMSDWAAYVSGVINSTCESCNYQWKNQSTPASVILAT